MNRAATTLPWIWASSGIFGTLHTYYFLGSQLGFNLMNLVRSITHSQGTGLVAGVVVGLTYALMLKPRDNRRRITVLGYLHLACFATALVASFIYGLEMRRAIGNPAALLEDRGAADLLLQYASVYLTPFGFAFYIAALVIALRTKTSATEVF